MLHLVSWFSTYVDLGIWASIGEFKTLGEFDTIQKKGIVFDIPFSFGIELGNNNNVSIGFAFYPHPIVEQFTSAFSVGIKLPLNNLLYR